MIVVFDQAAGMQAQHAPATAGDRFVMRDQHQGGARRGIQFEQ